MAWKTMTALTAVLTAGCFTQPAEPADNRTGNEAGNRTDVVTPVEPIQTRYTETISGQPLADPPKPFELLVTRATFASGHVISCHRHSWPRYVYIHAGRLRVTNQETRQVKEFTAGEVVVEAIGQWHHGDVLETVTLVAMEQVPPGRDNSTPWPPPPSAPSACPPRAQ
jgi:quercetin dioxygenase-like cupin family protein